MKKSNVIFGAIVLILALFGILYLIPVREGGTGGTGKKVEPLPKVPVGDTDMVTCPPVAYCNQPKYKHCPLCNKSESKVVKAVNSGNTVAAIQGTTKPKSNPITPSSIANNAMNILLPPTNKTPAKQ